MYIYTLNALRLIIHGITHPYYMVFYIPLASSKINNERQKSEKV